MQGGARVPYTIELDHELTVISEYADTTTIDHVAAGRRSHGEGDTPTRRKARVMSKWCAKSIEDNPIPGTDDLRTQYFLDFEKLAGEFASEGKACPGCEVGKLMRRYREKLEAEGRLQDA